MSSQSAWWDSVNKNLEKQKKINPTVDTCPLCWATSGLPAVVFKGEPESTCGPCTELVAQVKIAKN